MNEQSVVNNSCDGGDADQRRVLPVDGLQLHPRSKSRRSHRLKGEKEDAQKQVNEITSWMDSENYHVFLVLTVLRLLKRCLGASWPLQFFTYMLQLNSPSLQPTDCVNKTDVTRIEPFPVRSLMLFVMIRSPLGSNNLCPFFSHQPAGFISHESALAQKS